MPAVSTSTNVSPPRRSTVSIASRVVPGMSETITRSWPSRALSRPDLPTFGRPRMATPIASAPAGEARDDLVQQVARPVTVHGRDRHGLAEPQPVELVRQLLPGRVVHLV